MAFTANDKLKALAIVQVFETSRLCGDYAACVVLNDGAGISYGMCQFTHRSGALADVVDRYLANGGKVGFGVMTACLPGLRDSSPKAIAQLAANSQFRNALRSAAVTREMKAAQQAVAFGRYLEPATTLCAKFGFTCPLSLAVVYDSLVHGSFYRVARGVAADRTDEQAWITAYVRRRDGWLASYPRLAVTRYRTRFFLNQIAISNWELQLPVTVHGVRISDSQLFDSERAVEPATKPSVLSSPKTVPQDNPAVTSIPQVTQPSAATAEAAPILQRIGETASSEAERFDRVETVVDAVVSRTDAAKSLWATVIGAVSQAVWAVSGFLAGLPREVWITVAVIGGLLTLTYLYRQIELGRIRERSLAGASPNST